MIAENVPFLESGMLVIFQSPNGDDEWYPVKTGEVPDWIRSPDVMGRLVDGEVCQNISESGGTWFAARSLEELGLKQELVH